MAHEDFRPGQPGYDEELAGYQLAVRPRPAVVVAATGPSDVRRAVGYGLPVGVTATGHGRVVTEDGGVLVTTRRMAGVTVDPASATAWVAAGTRWDAVIDAAAPHGLAPLSGGAPHVGAVGYTLGGGIGLLSRRYGFAADHVRELEVVTADGELRRVGPGDDLFWALRGGRDNFGVVTGMRIGLLPVTTLYGGGLYFDTDLVPDALAAYLEWTATVPDELTSSIAVVPFPDVPALPPALRGRHAAHIRIAHLGGVDEGDRLAKPLRDVGPRLVDTLGALPYSASGTIHNDPPMPAAYHSTAALLRDFDATAARSVLAAAGPGAPAEADDRRGGFASGRACVIELRHLGGAMARPPDVPGAIGHRDAGFLLGVLSRLPGVDPDAEIAAVTPTHERVLAVTDRIGTSVNFLGTRNTADDVRSAYDPADRDRLVRLKAVHDPGNLFRLNANIAP